jgi:hypothetical protein
VTGINKWEINKWKGGEREKQRKDENDIKRTIIRTF